MEWKKSLSVMLVGLTVSACSNGVGTIYRNDSFGPYNVLSVDARQRLVIQGYKMDKGVQRPVICSEPSPDAISAQAASIAASTNVASGPNQSVGGQLAGGVSEAVASIAMRTQTIQLLRDGYFRLCEAYLNGVLDKEQYMLIIRFIDEFITTVVAIEAIGGTVVVPPAGAIATNGVSIDKDGGVEVKPSVAELKVTTSAGSQGDKNAAEIRKILDRYYQRKEQFQSQMEMLH